MKSRSLPFRIARAAIAALLLAAGTFLSIFAGMVALADHKFPEHNSMAGIEAFTFAFLVGLIVFALSLSVGLIWIFVKRAADPTTTY
jgi:hypothetical protein